MFFCFCVSFSPEETEAIISYVLSDTITPQAGALRRHQVAGKVVDPETDEPVQGVEVVLIAQDLAGQI